LIAEFYIIPESFSENPKTTVPQIEAKIQNFTQDFIHIGKHSAENKIFVNENIYNVIFVSKKSISDLLNDPTAYKGIIDRDTQVALRTIFEKSKTTKITIKEVKKDLIPKHNRDFCYGLIGFNKVEGIADENQIIYNINGWYDFRRYYLSVYPKNSEYFIDECNKYFPNLLLHKRNKSTVGSILGDCPKKIILHLSKLNDNFIRFRDDSTLNRTEKLKQFSIDSTLDEIATLEGNPARKSDFTFDFKDDNGNDIEVCCEPHIKLCYNDMDKSYSNNRRIYFHEGLDSIKKKKILIGHIGKHL